MNWKLLIQNCLMQISRNQRILFWMDPLGQKMSPVKKNGRLTHSWLFLSLALLVQKWGCGRNVPRWNQEAAHDRSEVLASEEFRNKYVTKHQISSTKHVLNKILTVNDLRFNMPEDGLPSIEDWLVTFHSILLDGLELGREPLDVSVRGWAQSVSDCWAFNFNLFWH